jgi:hypothetical protein
LPISRPGGLPSEGRHAPTTGGPPEGNVESGTASAVGDAEKGNVIRVGRDSVEAGTVAAARVAKEGNVVLLADGAPEVYNREDRAATADDAPALASRRRD